MLLLYNNGVMHSIIHPSAKLHINIQNAVMKVMHLKCALFITPMVLRHLHNHNSMTQALYLGYSFLVFMTMFSLYYYYIISKFLQIFNLSLIFIFVYSTPNLGVSPTWVPILGTCIIGFVNGGWTVYLPLTLLIPYITITITTIATFIFTRLTLKKNMKRHKQTLNTENLKIQKSIYSERIKNLIGIFGVLLLSNFILILPFLAAVIAALTIGVNQVPSKLTVSLFVVNLFSYVANPLIQACFIRDLFATFKEGFYNLHVKCTTVKGVITEQNNEEYDAITEGEKISSYILLKKK